MTATSHPYSDYKPSGIQWLGDVPTHWELVPSRAVFTEINERDHPDEQMLSVTIARGVIRQKILLQDSSQKDSSRLDKSAYKLVCPGDLAYNKMRAWQGAFGVSTYRGIVSPAYVVQRPRNGANALYFHHLLRTPAFAAEAERWSYGIASDMWSLRPEHFKMMYVPLPPLPEQAAIVRYLDYVDRRVRRYVSAKRKLVGLLGEEKQAVISQAVTRGLDPSVRLKPSGVEWLGDVPEHWEVRRLKALVTTGTGGRDTINRKEDGLYPFFVRSQTVERIDTWSFDGEAVLTAGDGVGVGKVFHYVNGKFDYHQRVYKFSDFRHILGKFFFHYFRSTLRNEVSLGTAKSTVDSLRLPMLQNFPVALPSLSEERAIIEYVDEATAAIDAAIERTRRQIELLQEYRTRLIADVVTGKLDVREAAAQLVEEDDEVDPIDEGAIMQDNTDGGSFDESLPTEEELAIESEVNA